MRHANSNQMWDGTAEPLAGDNLGEQVAKSTMPLSPTGCRWRRLPLETALRPRQSGDARNLGGAKLQLVDLEWLHGFLVGYGYWAIMVIIMLESAGVPMPGETTLVAAAVYAGTQHTLDIRLVIAAAAAGAIVGDNIGFWVGREFGSAALSRWGHIIGLDASKIKLGHYLFARHGGKIVFFGRFVALLRAFAALLAGVSRLEPWRFLIFNAAGGIAWATIFGVSGYILGESVHHIAGTFRWAALIVALLCIVWLWRHYKQHEADLLAEAERSTSSSA
jgi:membrane protein DedA with SNARE-associated domain